jgi:hypothetical protein
VDKKGHTTGQVLSAIRQAHALLCKTSSFHIIGKNDMRKKIALLLLGWIPFACINAQLRGADVSKVKLEEYRPDTLYYPFYKGVQMIVIDHVGPWTAAMHYKSRFSQDYTRIPSPMPNVYLFRHVSGIIVMAYNTSDSLARWARHFKDKPLAPPSGLNGYSWLSCHKLKGIDHYTDQNAYFFDGYYPIYGDEIPATGVLQPKKQVKTPDFANYRDRFVGLIDSLGIIRVQPVYRQILPLGPHLLVQKKAGEWGVMDMHLQTIVPFVYDGYKVGGYGLRDYYHFLQNKQTCALYHIRTTQLTPINCYDNVSLSDDGRRNQVIIVWKDGKIGFMSKQFVETVSPKYELFEHFYPYTESRYRVIRDGKWGFVNAWGQEAIPCVYEHVEMFEANKALVLHRGKWQYIDTAGQVLPLAPGKPKWKYENIHVADYQIVKSNSGKEVYGLVNVRTDSLVVPLLYDRIEQRHQEPFFRVSQKSQQGIIDLNGRLALPCAYEKIGEFDDKMGLAVVRKNGQQGIINRRFAETVPCTYEQLRFEPSGHLINTINGKEGLMDTLQRTIIPNLYDWLGGFYGLLRGEGHRFSRVRLNERYGYIDMQGREVVSIEYEEVSEASNYIIGVKKAGKWGFVDTAGQVVTPFVYDWIEHGFSWVDYENGYIRVHQGRKIGLINKRGKEVVPCEYDAIMGYANGAFTVKKDNQTSTVQVVRE